jgi:hypothetical protein
MEKKRQNPGLEARMRCREFMEKNDPEMLRDWEELTEKIGQFYIPTPITPHDLSSLLVMEKGKKDE